MRGIATKSSIAAVVALAVLVISGSSAAGAVLMTGATSTARSVHVTSLGSGGASYVGPAAKFLSGPTKVSPSFVAPGTAVSPTVTPKIAHMPVANPRPAVGSKLLGPNALTVPPVVVCAPVPSKACDSISLAATGVTTNAMALNAVDTDGSFGAIVEPPDQGLCASHGFVMEILNIGVLRVYNSGLGGGTADVTLDSLMGLTARNWSSGGDISCLYDPSNGGHWFITEFVSTTPESIGGTFVGCFAALLDGCREGIAVSVTNNPTGSWNVYFLDPNSVNSNPGVGYLLNDFVKIGNTRDAFLLFYDEFNQNGSTIPACPAYGCFGFNGAQQFAFNKKSLELGFPATEPFGGADPYLTVAYENMGTDPAIAPPDGPCFSGPTAGADCWYHDIPAASPDAAQFDNSHGGRGFILGPLDFFGAGDNRIAAFAWSNLSHLNSYGCSTCSKIAFTGTLFTGLQAYRDEGANCMASLGGFCGLAPQKAGPIPLGKNCVAFGLAVNVSSCPESGLATNGDGFTQVSYSQGQIWGALSTLVNQKFGPGRCGTVTAACEIHLGGAYWVIGTGGSALTLSDQGYVSPAHEDIEMPAIAAGDTIVQGAVVSFTLSGNGGPTGADSGGFFPSSAFGQISQSSHGLVGGVIHITAKGKGAQDGFSEYQGFPGPIRPRWGDYGAAIFVPGSSGGFYFASEYIQSPNCSPHAFLKDPSCGGTRSPFANWGSSINRL